MKNIGLTHVISVMPEEFKLFKKQGVHSNNILNLYFNGQVNKKYVRDIYYFEHFFRHKTQFNCFYGQNIKKKNEKYIKIILHLY